MPFTKSSRKRIRNPSEQPGEGNRRDDCDWPGDSTARRWADPRVRGLQHLLATRVASLQPLHWMPRGTAQVEAACLGRENWIEKDETVVSNSCSTQIKGDGSFFNEGGSPVSPGWLAGWLTGF